MGRRRSVRSTGLLAVALLAATVAPTTVSAQSFVAFESGHVRPLALSPNGTRLFAVNTPDDRLEIFDVQGGTLAHDVSVPVGLEPVAVAAPSNDEVWVVNYLSAPRSVGWTRVGGATSDNG
jgi:DNA-binding beta-propeller fold protein YncE